MTPAPAFNSKQQKHSILSNHNVYSYMAEKKQKKGTYKSTTHSTDLKAKEDT